MWWIIFIVVLIFVGIILYSCLTVKGPEYIISVCPKSNKKYKYYIKPIDSVLRDIPHCYKCGVEICPKCASHNVFLDKEKTAKNPVVNYGKYSKHQDQAYECKDCTITWGVRQFISICPRYNKEYKYYESIVDFINYSTEDCPICKAQICPRCGSHNIFLDRERTEKNPVMVYEYSPSQKDITYECKDCNLIWDIRE